MSFGPSAAERATQKRQQAQTEGDYVDTVQTDLMRRTRARLGRYGNVFTNTPATAAPSPFGSMPGIGAIVKNAFGIG